MARKGKKCYNWFLRPSGWRFVGRQRLVGRKRRKLVPSEQLREQGPFCGPVLIPNQHLHNTISYSIVELTIVGSSHGQPISIPGVILVAKQDLIGILFGGNLIREGNDYRVRFPNMVEAKKVHFEDFLIKVKQINDSGEEARLALLSYRPEVVQPCRQIQFGMNCSRNTPLFLYDFRLCENINGASEVYQSALNDGHVLISDHSTFVSDCTPVAHSYHGGLLFDSVGKLIGIAFDKIGPIVAFQVDFIWSALLEINPQAESIDDIFLNVRRI